jgi:Fungal Zn(2)-Cys(6) binuclear cluster domain
VMSTAKLSLANKTTAPLFKWWQCHVCLCGPYLYANTTRCTACNHEYCHDQCKMDKNIPPPLISSAKPSLTNQTTAPLSTRWQCHVCNRGPYVYANTTRCMACNHDYCHELCKMDKNIPSPLTTVQSPASTATPYPDTHLYGLGAAAAVLTGAAPPPFQQQYLAAPSSFKSTRSSKVHVPSACVNCRIKHLRCDNSRPCRHCVQSGKDVSTSTWPVFD